MSTILNKLSQEIRNDYLNSNKGKNIPSARTLAICSMYAYQADCVGSQILNEDENGESYYFYVKKRIYANSLSFLFIETETTTPKRVIISIAGSFIAPKDPVNLNFIDWSQYIFDIENEIFNIVKEHPSWDFYVCGHYIGGILAQIVAKDFRMGGASYEAIGINDPTISSLISTEPGVYDANHPRFCNHVIIERQKNYFINMHRNTFNPFFGTLREHWPYKDESISYGKTVLNCDKKFFFNMQYFVDFHFSRTQQKLTPIGRANGKNNEHICTHDCCYYSDEEKTNEEWWSKYGPLVYLSTACTVVVSTGYAIKRFFSPERPQPNFVRFTNRHPRTGRRVLIRLPGQANFHCSICLDDDETKDICELPCAHLYHWECIHAWFPRSNTCPICRDRRYNIFTKHY